MPRTAFLCHPSLSGLQPLFYPFGGSDGLEIGFELALFSRSPKMLKNAIMLFCIDTYVNFDLSKIGFVFSNLAQIFVVFSLISPCFSKKPTDLLSFLPLPFLKIGFVFSPFQNLKFFIITFYIRLCANFALPQIGFVFSNWFSQYASRSTQYEINWLCFSLPKTTKNHQKLHNSLLLLTLHHIAYINIGFVFSKHDIRYTTYYIRNTKLALFFQLYPFNSFRISEFELRISGRKPVNWLCFFK